MDLKAQVMKRSFYLKTENTCAGKIKGVRKILHPGTTLLSIP